MGTEIKKPSNIEVGDVLLVKGQHKVVASKEILDHTVRVVFDNGDVANYSVYATVYFHHEVKA